MNVSTDITSKPITLSAHQAECPHCGELSFYIKDDLYENIYNGCHHAEGWKSTGSCRFNETDQRVYTVLKVTPDDALYLVLADTDYGYGKRDYWFNEHTCPMNWIRDIRMVIAGEDNDPHGFAEHVGEFKRDHDVEGPFIPDDKEQEVYQQAMALIAAKKKEAEDAEKKLIYGD